MGGLLISLDGYKVYTYVHRFFISILAILDVATGPSV